MPENMQVTHFKTAIVSLPEHDLPESIRLHDIWEPPVPYHHFWKTGVVVPFIDDATYEKDQIKIIRSLLECLNNLKKHESEKLLTTI